MIRVNRSWDKERRQYFRGTRMAEDALVTLEFRYSLTLACAAATRRADV